MTHFSEEWYDRKRANIAAWKAMEAARSATSGPLTPQRPKADSATDRPTSTKGRSSAAGLKPPDGADAASRAPIYPLVGLCRAAGLPEPVPEYRFHAARRWRADYAWPLHLVIVEIEGGAWTQGRHTRGAGYVGDMAKYNAATLLGYRVLRYTPQQLGQAIADLRIMFAGGK